MKMGRANQSRFDDGLHASYTSFIVLSAVPAVLLLLYMWLAISRPASSAWLGAMMLAGIILAWWIWLRGYRVRLNEDVLEYRDGLYRTHRIRVSEITSAEHGWIEFPILNRRLTVPRLILTTADEENRVLINSKVFSRRDIELIRAMALQSGIESR